MLIGRDDVVIPSFRVPDRGRDRQGGQMQGQNGESFTRHRSLLSFLSFPFQHAYTSSCSAIFFFRFLRWTSLALLSGYLLCMIDAVFGNVGEDKKYFIIIRYWRALRSCYLCGGGPAYSCCSHGSGSASRFRIFCIQVVLVWSTGNKEITKPTGKMGVVE